MLFTQINFWLFFLAVLLVFMLIKKRIKVAHLWLLLASYFFYYTASGNFLILLLVITVLTYGFARLITKIKAKSVKKILLFFGILFDVSFLLYFKYTYFIIDLLNTYCNTDITAKDYLALFTNNTFHTGLSVEKIILPVGISFYTFQALSFLVDVYKDKFKQNVSFLDFAFYLSFFPQLVAGPIVRADNFIPQLEKEYSLTQQEFNYAFFLILNGLVKKIFVSDYISINFVDRVFSSPDTFSTAENLLASYGYTMQIYCDFSGYTDIAIAVSLLLGFKLPVNFNSPYKAINITDFWRRWHISLSSWLRDYIYIPLGGNRKGKFRRYCNLLATMLIGGLWHGANLKFIFWGFCHGVMLIIDKIIKPLTDKLFKFKIGRFAGALVTFHIVTALWIFFRSDSFDNSVLMLQRIIDLNVNEFPLVISAYWKPLSVIFIAFLIHILPERTKQWYKAVFYKMPFAVKIAVAVLTVFVLVQVKSSSIQPFIYFQF